MNNMNFSGPYSITLRPFSSGTYPITFRPYRSGEFHGVLILSNMQTSQNFSYNLKGIAQEPPAEECRTLICTAREKVCSSLKNRDQIHFIKLY